MYSYMRGIDTRHILGFCSKCRRLVRLDDNARQVSNGYIHLCCRRGRFGT
jgi:hypothetical protein